MSGFLHCHDCGWYQDDFWSKEHYHPFRESIVNDWKKTLFSDRIKMPTHLMKKLLVPYEIDKDEKNSCYVDGKDLVASSLIEAANSIKAMKIKTYKDFEKIKHKWKCPNCGSKSWDID